MNTQRPLPPEPREPLDADEASIANHYRLLPGGEPSPAVDARIFALARAAAATSRQKPRARPWFLGAGFGAAAAAVMAAGIAWQLGWMGSVPGTATPQTAPTAATGARARQSPRQPEAIERVDVEFIKQERAADSAPAAPAAPPPPPRAAKPAARNEPPAPPPPPEPAPVLEELRDLSTPAPEAFPAEVAPPVESDAAAGVLAGAGANDERERAAALESRSAPATAVRGFGVAKQQQALPPWAEDADLDPDAWLSRIRERVNRADRQGAEHSLRLFVLKHPNRDVPRELQRLLVE